MERSSTFAGFLKKHTRLIVGTLALLTLLSVATGTFLVQQRTGAHAAGPPTGTVNIYVDYPSSGVNSIAYRDLTQGSDTVCTGVNTGGITQAGVASYKDDVLIAEDTGSNCDGLLVASVQKTVMGIFSCTVEFQYNYWECV